VLPQNATAFDRREGRKTGYGSRLELETHPHGGQNDGISLFPIKGLRAPCAGRTKVYSFDFAGRSLGVAGMQNCLVAKAIFRIRCGKCRLERYHPVNAICPEYAELALVIAAKVNQSAATLPGAG
jgi:hypothetical protein